MSLHAIAQGPPYGTAKLQTFVVVAEKDSSTAISDISSFLGEYSVERYGNQVKQFHLTSRTRKFKFILSIILGNI